jgi:hypothetical protein
MALQGEAKTAYMRAYMRRRRAGAAKPKRSAADDSAPLKARIRELEADVARLKTELEAGAAMRQGSLTAMKQTGDGKVTQVQNASPNRLRKLIVRLGNMSNDNDHDVLQSVRKVDGELRALGKDFHALAELTEQWDKEAKQRPTKPKPVDFTLMEPIIVEFVEGKTKVNFNKLLKAVNDGVPGLREQENFDPVYGYMYRCLGKLGFKASRSGTTWERPAS